MKRKIWISTLVTLGILVGGYFVFRNLENRNELRRGFPLLSAGAYVGEIKLESATGDKQQKTIYVERLRDGDTLLVVIFEEGFQPQTLFPERLVRYGNTESYKPLNLKFASKEIKLVGKEQKSEFFGVVRSAGNDIGQWKLRRMRPDELVTATLGGSEADMLQLLQAKEKGRIYEARLDETEKQLKELRERVVVMDNSLEDESTLRVKAEQRRAELQGQLAKLKSESEQTGRNLDNLVSELDLIGRITKWGATVSLERKIAQREARWYDVNWQSEEELDPQTLSDEETGVDLNKLEIAVKKAREIKSLLAEREEEVRKIRELERGGTRGSGEERVPTEERRKEEEPSKDLWDRLFG